MVGSGHRTAQTAPTESPRRPRQILSVFPQEDGVACPTTEVHVRFGLKGAMLEEGVMDMVAFSLALDDENVTAETKMLGICIMMRSGAYAASRQNTAKGGRGSRSSCPQSITKGPAILTSVCVQADLRAIT